MLNVYKNLTKKMILEIDEWIGKFPEGNTQSVLIAALTIIQKHNNGWLSKELLNEIAEYLKIPLVTVYEVANFYPKFELKLVGKHKINICTNVPCMLSGCNRIVQHVKNKLNINFGETTTDLKFSLRESSCIAACDKAPVIQINEQEYSKVTLESIDQILSKLERS